MLPILIKSDWLIVYSYPFMMGIAWAFGYRITNYLYLKYNLNFSKVKYHFIGLFISSFLGAKLAFLVLSSGDFFDVYTKSLSFWFGGGFVFYGGLIAGLLWTTVSCKLFKLIRLEHLKYFLPGTVFGHAIGRIGCFLAGCCYGHKLEGGEHFPIQLVEALFLFIFGYFLLKKLNMKNLVSLYLIYYGALRFIVEFFRADEIRGKIPLNLSSSQGISILIIFMGFLLLLRRKSAVKSSLELDL